MDAVFRVSNVTKTYEMGEVRVHALRGVDMDLNEGELLVLLGPSGSGKSTLLNILGGLDTATSGQVLYRDQDLTAADDNRLTEYRRHHVGFVFQFYNLIPSLTARENVAVVLQALERVNRDLGTATAIITHNVAQAEIAERIVQLRNGKITSIEHNPARKAAAELSW
jgi:ABC-type lipoprotein export system ATPase subunit